MKTSFKTIDTHKSVLIIGVGATNKYLYEVVQPEYSREMYEVFGPSALTESYQTFIEGLSDTSNVYVLNLEVEHDYTKIAEMISNYDFSYVVPVDVLMSDYYLDPNKKGQKTYLVQDMIEKSGQENNSIFIITDKHASLYQDIDQYLTAMNEVEGNFKTVVNNSFVRENTIFVANNLKNIEYSNVILAKMIVNSAVNEYPAGDYIINAYQTVFDMDYIDSVSSMAYFRKHANNAITIENLLNLAPDKIPTKIFTIYRICLYIAKELDFTDFLGSHYTAYKKQQIENIVTNYLSSVSGVLITNYKINQVYAEENEHHPGTVNVILKYSIKPIGCAERFVTQSICV